MAADQPSAQSTARSSNPHGTRCLRSSAWPWPRAMLSRAPSPTISLRESDPATPAERGSYRLVPARAQRSAEPRRPARQASIGAGGHRPAVSARAASPAARRDHRPVRRRFANGGVTVMSAGEPFPSQSFTADRVPKRARRSLSAPHDLHVERALFWIAFGAGIAHRQLTCGGVPARGAKQQLPPGNCIRRRRVAPVRRRGRRRVDAPRRGRCCPEAAVRAVPARLLLLCLLLRSSWLTVEGDRRVGAAGVLHRRGGRVVVAVSVGVAGGVPDRQCRPTRSGLSRVLQVARRSDDPSHEDGCRLPRGSRRPRPACRALQGTPGPGLRCACRDQSRSVAGRRVRPLLPD